jgi:hypothetical protein
VHRAIECLMQGVADTLAVIGEAFEVEAIHLLGDEEDLYLRRRPTGCGTGRRSR